jgi:hypothetical protein
MEGNKKQLQLKKNASLRNEITIICPKTICLKKVLEV